MIIFILTVPVVHPNLLARMTVLHGVNSKVLITSQLDTNLIMKENNSQLKENNSLLKELIKAIKEKNDPISMENVAVDPLPSRA